MTGSGKSCFVRKLIKYKNDLFDKPVSKIMYAYGVWTDEYDEMEREMEIEFHKNLPTEETVNSFIDGKQCLLIIDDLMDQCVKDTTVQNLFTRTSHHKKLTIVYLSQNLFCQGKTARNINLNTHYIVLMKSVRDINQISVLGNQLGLKHTLVEAYSEVIQKPYGYLVVDLSPHNYNDFRIVTNIFPDEGFAIVYKPLAT